MERYCFSNKLSFCLPNMHLTCFLHAVKDPLSLSVQDLRSHLEGCTHHASISCHSCSKYFVGFPLHAELKPNSLLILTHEAFYDVTSLSSLTLLLIISPLIQSTFIIWNFLPFVAQERYTAAFHLLFLLFFLPRMLFCYLYTYVR